MTLREAAIQALEALESIYNDKRIMVPREQDEAMNTAITVLCNALAEPEQEPVAWRFEARQIDTAWMVGVSFKRPGDESAYMRNITPLYTTPTPRKPLTEDEIDRIANHLDETAIGWSAHEFARAIERAHGIGEQHGS